ncbi:MAG: folylpolyglutamate synthase/dihydrofolate synthase family protein [Terrimicrobiaceae bacterium]
MGYDEALEWLFSTQKFGIKLGLGNTLRLLEALGNPHHAIPCFHVAGTNGKGSVCAMLDEALRQPNHPVGLYTSPHLVDFTERIRIDGCPASREAVADGLTRLRELTATWSPSPTFFEFTTVLAFDIFRAAGCRTLVIETGMGGRLDATNVVDPVVSVLTPIGMDHAQWLGPTPAAIAGEKAGIIKPGRPAVSAPQIPEVTAVFELAAQSAGSPLSFVTQPWDGPLSLRGPHQRWNASLAMAAMEAACRKTQGFGAAMERVSWPGRFQIVRNKWVLDGAHNPHAAKALAAAWRESFGDTRAPVIFGCLADKDPVEILAELQPIASTFHFVPVASERAADPHALLNPCGTHAHIHESPHEAIRELASAPGPVLISGSLFLVGEVLEILQQGSP